MATGGKTFWRRINRVPTTSRDTKKSRKRLPNHKHRSFGPIFSINTVLIAPHGTRIVSKTRHLAAITSLLSFSRARTWWLGRCPRWRPLTICTILVESEKWSDNHLISSTSFDAHGHVPNNHKQLSISAWTLWFAKSISRFIEEHWGGRPVGHSTCWWQKSKSS